MFNNQDIAKAVAQADLSMDPFGDMASPETPEAMRRTIQQADTLLQAAGLASYTELLRGIDKLTIRATGPNPVHVAWLHEHITPLKPPQVFARRA